MNYRQLRESMKDFTLFSLTDIRRVDPAFHRRRLNEWQDKGYLRKVVKGYYVFADRDLDERALFEIANRIYKPSYVSLESALAYHQLIPESPFGVTSVSTRRTYEFRSELAVFRYRTIRPRLFFGYELAGNGAGRAKIARPAKAILDLLYLNPRLRREPDFDSLRIAPDRFFEAVSMEDLKENLARIGRKALSARVEVLMRSLRNRS